MVDHATLTVRSWLGSAEVDFTDGHHPCNRTATGSRLVRDHAHRHFRHDHSELRPRPRRPSLPPQTLHVWGKGRFAPLPQNLTQLLTIHRLKAPSDSRSPVRHYSDGLLESAPSRQAPDSLTSTHLRAVCSVR